MGKRVPLSERTRQRIREVMEGRFGGWDRSEIVGLAVELIMEEAYPGPLGSVDGW